MVDTALVPHLSVLAEKQLVLSPVCSRNRPKRAKIDTLIAAETNPDEIMQIMLGRSFAEE